MEFEYNWLAQTKDRQTNDAERHVYVGGVCFIINQKRSSKETMRVIILFYIYE